MEPWKAPSRPRRNAAANDRSTDWGRLLGRKISIRYRLHDDPEHPFSEAIGVVSAVEQGDGGACISILTRRGATVDVSDTDILAVKEFPAT